MYQTLFRRMNRQVRIGRTFNCRIWNNESAKSWNFFIRMKYALQILRGAYSALRVVNNRDAIAQSQLAPDAPPPLACGYERPLFHRFTVPPCWQLAVSNACRG